MSVELLGAVSPVHVLGESHGLNFSNLHFRPAWSRDTFLCRTRFFPVLMAAHYSAGNDLNADLVNGLVSEGILSEARRPTFVVAEPSVTFLLGLPVIAPPMIFFAGDLDLHLLFQQMGDKFDFKLPDDPAGYGVDKSKQILTYPDVRGQLSASLTPFLNAMTRLQAAGFRRLMIHCLPPRTADNASASEWTKGMVVDAPVRAKLTLVANQLIEAFCIRSEIAFIDTWPELTAGGYLRPEFELDGVHVNRKAVLVSLEKIAACLFDRTSHICNPVRHGQASQQADAYTDADADRYAAAWREKGFVVGRADSAVVEQMRGGLVFDRGQENAHARPDWVGWPRAGRPHISLADPDESLLADAAAMLGDGDVRAMLHAGSQRELTVISFRPVRFAPEACESETLPSPPGTRRALLFLSPTDRVTFETPDGRAIPCSKFDTGSMIVYDSARVRFRLSSGESSVDLVELAIVPRLPGQPFRVVWAGLCDWPADPFQFSVAGMKAFPKFGGSVSATRVKV